MVKQALTAIAFVLAAVLPSVAGADVHVSIIGGYGCCAYRPWHPWGYPWGPPAYYVPGPPVVYAPPPPVIYAPPPVVYAAPPPVVYAAPPPVVYAAPPPNAAPASGSYVDKAGRTCREYQTTVTLGGAPQSVHGTACLQPDGSWQMVR
jgi:hypothetical protein